MEKENFNINEALSRLDGDAGLLRELAGLFLENYPAQLEGIQSAVAQNDSKALENAAHNIKGSAGVICAKPVFEVAQRLEIMGKENNLTSVKEMYATLEKELGRLRSKLEAIIVENPL
ncbi:MAG: Hpt domain protein [Candidatus Brocadia sinica]|nr:MAG: Hpt domain protein [Candidatus Brocadia sinica]MCK6467178.1 Hpt domain-containing protein [Candidatus Brocadia sinica]NUO04052.1 Hpt domain-containing protein [Candidatus Brocadia sinica]